MIGWRRDTPLPPLLYYGQRAPKRYASLQTSLTSSIFRASELPYSTWRTFSALHSPRYAPPPSHGRSLKRPSALLAGSSLDERVAHRHFHFVSNSGKLKEKQRDARTPKEKPGKQHTNKKRKKQPGQLTFKPLKDTKRPARTAEQSRQDQKPGELDKAPTSTDHQKIRPGQVTVRKPSSF